MSRSAKTAFVESALVLGILTAIGPFAIDMYIPALPAIAASLKADTGEVQLSLTVYFFAVAIGQLFYGPFSDMTGRRLPLYVGLALFAAGSVGCALAPNIETLIAFRFVQAIGACGGIVVPRAVVRDLYTGHEAARMMSLIMLVFSVSPILAPSVGSLFAETVGWRAIFVAITVGAAAGIVVVALFQPETLPRAARLRVSVGTIVGGYWRLMKDTSFLRLSFIGGCGMAAFFAYVATSPFVYVDAYGLSPSAYALTFSANAIAFIGMSQLTGRLAARLGLERVMRLAVLAFASFIVLLTALFAAGFGSVWLLIGGLFLSFGWLGLVLPTTAVLTMEEQGDAAGTASALMGTLQLVCGAAVTAVTSAWFDGTALPMLMTIAACGLIALALALWRPAPRAVGG